MTEVAGWGTTSSNGPTSNVPLVAAVPLVTNEQCDSDYSNEVIDLPDPAHTNPLAHPSSHTPQLSSAPSHAASFTASLSHTHARPRPPS